MAINKHHAWNYYAGMIPNWRQQAVNNYKEHRYAVRHAINWKNPVHEQIRGVDVTFYIGSGKNNEEHPNDKKRGVKRAIERIKDADPNIAIPHLYVYMLNPTQGPKKRGINARMQIQTVATHVDRHGNDRATIVLSSSSLLENPIPIVGGNRNTNPLNAPVLKCKNRDFYATSGTKRARGIADYWAESIHRYKDSNRVAAIVIHEIGHVLHQIQHPERFWPLNCIAADFQQNPNISINVSLYASNSLCEFVAEVFTARILGCTIIQNNQTIGDYTTLGGPLLIRAR